MKIALVGYGRMGHAIERIARERGHEITAIIDVNNHDEITGEGVRNADVVIEFTTPATALDNYRALLGMGKAVVSGTTGWWPSGKAAVDSMLASNSEAKLLWTSNFSLGVNIFFAVNRYLAKIMARFPQYQPTVHEIHHVHKLDHPSGTAVTIAEQILSEHPTLSEWSERTEELADKLIVTHQRISETPGTHTVTWESPVDSLIFQHTSKSRDGLALGAVIAAEWLPTATPGFHTLEEMLGF